MDRIYFCRCTGVITVVFLGANCRNVDVIVLVTYSIILAGAIVRTAIDSSVDVGLQLDMKAKGQFISLQGSFQLAKLYTSNTDSEEGYNRQSKGANQCLLIIEPLREAEAKISTETDLPLLYIDRQVTFKPSCVQYRRSSGILHSVSW